MIQIAREVGVNKNTVLLIKKKLNEFGDINRKIGSGRKKVSTPEQDQQLVTFLQENSVKTTIKAKKETGFPGSTQTARRRISQSELRNRCAANKIFLTE